MRTKGQRMLDWPWYMRPLSLAFIATAGFVVYAALHADPRQATIAMVIATLFVAGALYLAYVVFAVRVWWTPAGIGASHPLGRARFLRWEDIRGGAYRPVLQAFVVEGEGERIWYSPAQTGWDALERYLSLRLRSAGVPAWHGVELHGRGYEVDTPDGPEACGFVARLFVRDRSLEAAKARALKLIADRPGPVRALDGARIDVTVVRSMMRAPDLPEIDTDIRGAEPVLYPAETPQRA